MPERYGRAERLVLLTQMLMDRPATLLSLGDFVERLGAAKSTVSEDLALVRETLQTSGAGRVETYAGAAGGVIFWPVREAGYIERRVGELCSLLSEPERVIPGGFVYHTDLIFSPAWAGFFGELVLSHYWPERPDYVLTVETKGVPLAMMVARAFGVPMAVARSQGRVTEGSNVSINFLSGSDRRIQTMSLSRRSLPQGSRVLIVDDFMKAGGTARGMVDLLAEFDASVFGMAFLVETAEPESKLVSDYLAVVRLEAVDETARRIAVAPSPRLRLGGRSS